MSDLVTYHTVPEWVTARAGDPADSVQALAEQLAAQGMQDIDIENGVVIYRDPDEEDNE